ncbi:MAG: NifB/NifX family molybdenum-iron cluster-binding protein [archaeon]|nr:NifB/NifX family molybdenum-iron cluster-binding protein [archaeon]
MRIAVTYADGQVFQHFGRTEFFKVYQVEGGKVTSSEVCPCNGASHSGVGMVLKSLGADVLLCGGMGMGAYNMVQSMGIQLVSGITGDADQAVEMFLKGEFGTESDAGVHACHGH